MPTRHAQAQDRLRPDLKDTLEKIGVPPAQQNRRALRSMIQRSIGVPAGERQSMEELVHRVLDIHALGRLVIPLE